MLAVDCGASHVVCGVFASNGSARITLRQFAFQALPAAAPEAAWAAGVAKAAGAFQPARKFRGGCALAIAGRFALAKFVRIPDVETAKRARIIRFEAQQAIPYPLGEVVWDWLAAGEDGPNSDVMLAAVKLGLMESLGAALHGAGLAPSRAVPACLALRRAFAHNYPDAPRSALIADIGARSTELLFIEQPKRFFARTLALGHNAGEPGAADASAFAGRLHLEITRSLMHLRRPGGAERPDCIYLAGAGSLFAELSAVLAEKLQLRVECYDALRNVGVSTAARAAGATAGAPGLAVLVGLAAGSADGEPAGFDLLPPALRRARAFRRRQPFLLGAAALLMVTLVPPIVHYHRVFSAARESSAALAAELIPQREWQRSNASALARIGETRAQLLTLRRLAALRSGWSDFLADLQERLGEVNDVWLDRLSVLPAKNSPGAGLLPSAPGLRLSLSGRLLDRSNPQAKVSPDSYGRVKALLAGFAGSPFIAAVEDERFDNREPGILRFDFVLVINPEHSL